MLVFPLRLSPPAGVLPFGLRPHSSKPAAIPPILSVEPLVLKPGEGQQHTTPATGKGATASAGKPISSRSTTLCFVKKEDVVTRLSSSELKAAVGNGEFVRDDLIRKSEEDEWTELWKVKGLDFNRPS